MDELEWNSTEPQGDEPTKEPTQTSEVTQTTQQSNDPPPASGFYAWSGSSLPAQESASRQKTSPFANSPYVNAAPAQPRQPQQTRATATPSPAKKKAPRSAGKNSILPMLAALICIILVVTAFLMNGSRFRKLNNELQKQAQLIEHLENQLAAASRPQIGIATNDTPVRVPSAEGVMTPAQVYAQCVPSVVAINCTGIGYNGFGQAVQTGSSGSGFVLSEDGYIVTNYHVVKDSKTIEISMFNGTTYKAEYIGGNEANDIALIKVDAKDLPPVAIGSSSDLIVGDQVAAIGNPLGELASTLTVGYVSAKDRIVTSEGTQINMLQTDAAINPGNSGGPLFNMYGQVVGITSAKYSGTTNSGATIEGIGFAIPTDDVMMMLEDLKTFGYVTGGYLGVTVSEVSQNACDLYGLPQGVLVRDVMPGSCAEKAGMRSQDIIIDLGGNEVKNLNSLSRALNKFKGGQEVIVTVYRSGREVELTVILDERPQEEKKEPTTNTAPSDSVTPWPGDSFFDDWFGQFFG